MVVWHSHVASTSMVFNVNSSVDDHTVLNMSLIIILSVPTQTLAQSLYTM